MANHPRPFNMNSPGAFSSAFTTTDPTLFSAEHLILDLLNPDLRENALHVLSKKREIFQDLAPMLWHSACTTTILIQEVVVAYRAVTAQIITAAQSNRVCNALALLQCIASHPETRPLFLKANVQAYLFPFLRISVASRPFEFLRLTTLGVIGALVKVDDTEVIRSLVEGEVVPLCLRAMEYGSELSKTVATFIVQKVLLDDLGLQYMCTKSERFFSLAKVLARMVTSLAAEGPSPRLLKHIIRCYLRLTDNLRACDALGSCLPDVLRDRNFIMCLYDDMHAMQWLQQLLNNVSVGGLALRRFEPMF